MVMDWLYFALESLGGRNVDETLYKHVVCSVSNLFFIFGADESNFFILSSTEGEPMRRQNCHS